MSIDPDEARREEAMEKAMDETLQEISTDNVREYLGTHGDAIEKRVRGLVKQAEELHKIEYYGSSLTLSISAVEITIRFMLLNPLMRGAFLYDDWAEILVKSVLTSQTSRDRDILPKVLKQWGIELPTIKLPDGRNLWESILKLFRRRNVFVHGGNPIEESESKRGIESINSLFDKIVYPVSKELGFTVQETNRWCEIKRIGPNGLQIGGQIFPTKSPF